MAAMITVLWLCVLLTADFGAAGNSFANNEDQCLVKLVVDLALQVQEQSHKLEQQAAQLQEQSVELRSLQDKVNSVETDLDWITGNLTALNTTRAKPGKSFILC
eukprot:TRINITY_DN2022_c0_g1_i1.p2 TRINITY_DN2022_c0_g1~~TRINITY_DN2022_c0_g1_i1.p2  ORF type:complete len:104 (+),score=26.14 TRINITY_DN2022_c0_g1_i1:317-628(+)